MMTKSQFQKLETIIGKIEALQGTSGDANVRSRLLSAKNELLRLYSEEQQR